MDKHSSDSKDSFRQLIKELYVKRLIKDVYRKDADLAMRLFEIDQIFLDAWSDEPLVANISDLLKSFPWQESEIVPGRLFPNLITKIQEKISAKDKAFTSKADEFDAFITKLQESDLAGDSDIDCDNLEEQDQIFTSLVLQNYPLSPARNLLQRCWNMIAHYLMP